MTAYASAARNRELFDAARDRVTVEVLVKREGLKVVKAGKELRTACPVCGAGSKSLSAFAIKGLKWRCWGSCDKGGDVVDLEQALRGGTSIEAARRLIGSDVPSGETARTREVPPAPEGPSRADRLAGEIWQTCRPFTGTMGERYLRHRGICQAVIAQAAPNLRYHPFAKHSWDEAARQWITAPAMVLQVVTPGPAGELIPTGGIHVTYLARDGSGKALIRTPDGRMAPAKRMWGPQLGADGTPGGAWLIGPDGEGDLTVSEGVETGLSVATLAARAGLPLRVAAALSLGRLQGGLLRDAEGCIDPIQPQGDPEHPPFTWPVPTDRPWRGVSIAVDRDMSEVRIKARTGRNRICDFLLTSEVRARICGRLAVEAWKATGVAARAIAPSPRCDFNDELRRVLARESAS